MSTPRRKPRPQGQKVEGEPERITDDFRRDVRQRLADNKLSNRSHQRRRGGPGWQIENQAELAAAIGVDKNLVRRMLGPAKGTAPKDFDWVDWSASLADIRRVLNMAAITTLDVPSPRAVLLRILAGMEENRFRRIEAALEEWIDVN